MNERIQELLKQAAPRPACAGDWYSMSPKMVEKFAELIVRECIDKIETHQIPVGNSAAGEMACEWTYDALKEIRGEIKRHFGVEE
jgi:hypothetical protein